MNRRQRQNGGDGTDYAPRPDAKSPPVALHVDSSESYEMSFRGAGGGGNANDDHNAEGGDGGGAAKRSTSLYPSARRLSPGPAPDGGGDHHAEAPRPRRSDAKRAPPPPTRASAGGGGSSQQGKRSSGASRQQETAPSRGSRSRGQEAAPSTRASSASRASRRGGGERRDGGPGVGGGGKRASSASAAARASARSPPPDAKANPETIAAASRVRGSSPGLSPDSNKSGSGGGVSSPGGDAPLLNEGRWGGSGGQRRSQQQQQQRRGQAQAAAAIESNNSYEVSYNDVDGGVAIARSAESPPKSERGEGGEESSPRSRERKAKARKRRGSDDAQPGGPVKESSPHRHSPRRSEGRRSTGGGGRRGGKSGSSSPDAADRRARRERLARASRVHAETAVPATIDGGAAANGVGMSRGDLSKLLTLCEDAVAALQEEKEQRARNARRSTFAASSDAAAIARAAAAAVAAASIEQSATQSTSGTGGTTATTPIRSRMSTAAAAAREEAAAVQAVWDDMHRWFADHPSPADRHDAVMNHHGEYGVTPLHVLCRHGDPPLDVVTLVLASAPQATEKRDTFGWLPLHYACASGCPEDVLAALVLHGPESTRAQDRRGRTPLHFALGSGQRKQNRGTRRSIGGTGAGAAAAAEAGRSGSISLSATAERGTDEAAAAAASAATAAAVAWEGEGLSPTAVSILSDHGASARCDENRMLPLHYACAYGSLSEESLSALIRSNPDATTAVDKHGRTPLHFAMGNADKNASPHTCRALLEHDMVLTAKMINMFDKEGQLPLHLLAIQAKRHDKGMIGGGGGDDNSGGGGGKGGGPGKGGIKGGPGGGGGGRKISSSISDEAAKYLDAEANARSCLGLYLDASPLPSADFLTALQSLPQWLRDYAVTSQHVQHVLNEKISQRFPTAILFLDFYVLITIIVCFRIASKSCIDYRFSGDGTDYVNHCGGPLLIVLYACATYFFLREVVQALSLWSLGSFQMWMADPKNFLDVVTFAAVYFFTAAMQIGFVSDDVLRTGTAVTTGLLWGSMISFLKSTLVDFAVFVDGVVFVLKRLAAFLLALSVIIVAFAMMFSTVFAWTPMCEEYPEYSYEPIPGYDTLPVEDFPFCTMTGSLMKCFTMLVGEVDEQIFTTTISKFLYALYAFLVVLLLFNVLIAIVIDSYGVIKNERAAMVFWSNRLDFVAEMDAISYYYDCRDHDVKQKETMLAMGGGAGYAESTTSSVGSGGGSSVGGGANTLDRKAWDLLLSLFEDQDLDKTSFEFMFYLFLRTVVALVAIPMWLLLGLATAGVLWPPQVREWLLVQKTTEEFKTQDQHHTLHSFYEVNTLKVDVRKFKAGVKSQMRADREEVISFRTEAESFSGGMMSELTQVSEIMRSILDMRRSALAAAKKKKKKTKKQKQQQQQGGSVSLSSRTSNEESRVARAGTRGTPTNSRRGHTETSSTTGYDI